MAQRMTDEQAEKTWRLFRISWYICFSLALLCFFFALMNYLDFRTDYMAAPGPMGLHAGQIKAMLYAGWGLTALLGCGMIRLQSRIEGQHMELARMLRNLTEGRSGSGS